MKKGFTSEEWPWRVGKARPDLACPEGHGQMYEDEAGEVFCVVCEAAKQVKS